MRFRLWLMTLACMALQAQELRLRYPLPTPASVEVVEGTVYRQVDGGKLEFDLYRPAQAQRSPVVIFLNSIGSSDLKRWPIYQDWGRVVTARGLAGITMDSRLESVASDFRVLLDYVRGHAAELRVDPDNVSMWVCSANVRAGLPIAMDPANRELKAAVIYYGAGEATELRLDLPLLYVRVGTDDVSQNRAIDALVARALTMNAPLSVINLPSARHAFDALDDDPVTHDTVERTLDFLEQHAKASYQATLSAGVTLGKAAGAVYREDWSAAIAEFRKIAAERPRDSEIRRRLGDALMSSGAYSAAVTEYEQSIALGNQRSAWIAYSAAVASLKMGKRDAAMGWIEKFKDVAPLKARLARDEDFAALRSDPHFREIAGLGDR